MCMVSNTIGPLRFCLLLLRRITHYNGIAICPRIRHRLHGNFAGENPTAYTYAVALGRTSLRARLNVNRYFEPLREAGTNQAGSVAAEHVRKRFVDGCDGACRVQRYDALRHMLQHRTQPADRALQLLFSRLPTAFVSGEAGNTFQLSGVGKLGMTPQVKPACFRNLLSQPDLNVDVGISVDGVLKLPGNELEIFWLYRINDSPESDSRVLGNTQPLTDAVGNILSLQLFC